MLLEVLNGKKHDRENFDCGEYNLNRYLKKEASQDVKNNLCQVYVIVEDSDNYYKRIFGYFSLNSYSLLSGLVPDSYAKNIKKYPIIPAILLGRLAKDKNQFLLNGDELMYVVLKKAKSIAKEIGGVFLVVHPKKGVENFYTRNGFLPLLSKPGEYIYLLKQVK